MKSIVIFFTLVFLNILESNRLNAQVQFTGHVIDGETKEVLSYVNIGIPHLGIGTVSDEKGVFHLRDFSSDDTISISYLGYEELRMSGNQLLQLSSIEMFRKSYSLALITINAKNYENEVVLGVKNKSRGHSIGFGNTQLGTEVGALIFIDKPTYIKSAHFVLNHAQGDSLLFRVNIYDFKNNEVGKKLINKNIYIKEKQRKGVVSIDLSEHEIILENNVMLSLEWLKNFDELGNKGITFDTKKSKKLKGVYLKNSSNSKFDKLKMKKNLNPCFYFIGKQ